MRKLAGALIVVLMLGGLVGYGIHLWLNHEKIEADLRDKAARSVTPVVDGDSVSEIGYVYGMHREDYYRDGFATVQWFIAIPATGDRLGCGYLWGSLDFKIGDGVTIIHNTKTLDQAEVGYIVGLHERRKGKVAKIDCNDLDIINLETDDER